MAALHLAFPLPAARPRGGCGPSRLMDPGWAVVAAVKLLANEHCRVRHRFTPLVSKDLDQKPHQVTGCCCRFGVAPKGNGQVLVCPRVISDQAQGSQRFLPTTLFHALIMPRC
jgi:hypothetical protein